jgi:hypothetical protein
MTTHTHGRSDPVRAGLLVLAFVVAGLVAAEQPVQAKASTCSSGQVCHYSAFNLDASQPHIKHYGNNANWNSQFPAMTRNDWSVINKGTSGMSVETRTGIYGLGSRAYCVRNTAAAWNLYASGGQGRSHTWISGATSGCL